MFKLLENFSICSMMPFRDLKDYQGISSWGHLGHPGLTNPLGKQHQVAHIPSMGCGTGDSIDLLVLQHLQPL